MMRTIAITQRGGDAGEDVPHEDITAWISRYQGWLWRYLRFLDCDPDLAEDICQETFLTALHHGIPDRPAAIAGKWLRTTARNCYLMQVRRHHREGAMRTLEDLDALSENPAVSEPEVADNYGAALRACLRGLSDRGRKAPAQ